MNREKIFVDELNLIQAQVQRMAGNSFIIKGWHVTFMSVFITYIFSKKDFSLILLGIIPILGCAIYDCYFLRLERLYREKYNWVIENIGNNEYLFNLNPYEEGMLDKKTSWKNVLFSKPIIVFYFLPLIIFIVVA